MAALRAILRIWRGRLAVRLAAAVFALSLVISFLLGWLRGKEEEHRLAQRVAAFGVALTSTATASIADAILTEDQPLLKEYCRDIVAQTAVPVAFVRVERADGKVLVQRGTEPTDPEAAEVQVVEAPALLQPERVPLGRTLIGIDVSRWRTDMRAQVLQRFTESLLAGAAIAFALMLLLRRMIGTPLMDLGSQAERIGRGDLEEPVTLAARDEFGRLAATLERMRVGLRESHASLAAQNQQLTELDRMKDEFLANMSHEIRTPLQAILGNVALLEPAAAGRRDDNLEAIQRNAGHLLCLVNQVLDFSKLQGGNFAVERDRTELQPLVADVAACLRTQAEAKGLRLETAIAAEAPAWLHTDGLRLRQILLNLVGNAVKFTERGSVRIDCARLPDDKLRITVTDTGPGIPAELGERLFQQFVTGDSSLTRRHGGTGLGLVISRALARRLGGDVTLANAEGGGTVATVVVAIDEQALAAAAPPAAPVVIASPTAPAAAANPAAAATLPARPAPVRDLHGRVLLVDDSADNRRLFTVVLQRSGLEVVTANNGAEACDAVQAAASGGTPFDLVLMDVQMPVLDGCSAVARMRADGCQLPVLALTAHATGQDQQRCLAVGFDDYITKPIGPRQLTEVVRSHLAER